MKIGIFGGTFNPIHAGHLVVAQDAFEALKLSRVLFIPCATPPHKTPEALAPAADRLRMIKLAIRGDKRFAVSDVEIKRGGVSYSIDTLRALRASHPATEWFFIIGADSFLELHKWREIDALAQLCQFAVVGRPGFKLPPRLRTPKLRGVAAHLVTPHFVDIASTEIRHRVREKHSIRYLVPDAVNAYIQRHSLYQ